MSGPDDSMPWWTGQNDERFSAGPFPTREEAIEQSSEEYPEGFWLIQAAQDPLRLSAAIDGADILERAEEHTWEEFSDPDSGEPLSDHITQAQIDDLTAKLKAAADLWQDQHKIEITPYTFTRSGNAEYIKGLESE